MKTQRHFLTLAIAMSLLLAAILGCSKLKEKPDWTKMKKIAGKQQRLSHISGMVIDDKFVYVTMGGTLADQNEGNSGLRKVALDTGNVTLLDDGKKLPQSENGGIALDDKYVYWNREGNILRISKDGGTPEVVAADHVGVGVDMVVDGEKLYWVNHGYYSQGSPTVSAIYMVAKQGGKTEIFADQQRIPHCLATDEKNLYWLTANAVVKQAKTGGQTEVVHQISDKEGLDELSQESDSLYFGWRSPGNSRWGLRKVSKQGGEATTLVKTYSLKPVVVDETTVYFFDEESLYKDAFCKVSKNGGQVTRIDTGYETGVIAQSKTQVYFGSMNDIYSYGKEP